MTRIEATALVVMFVGAVVLMFTSDCEEPLPYDPTPQVELGDRY